MKKIFLGILVYCLLFSTQLVYAISAPSNLSEVSKTSNSIDFQFLDQSNDETSFSLFRYENNLYQVVYGENLANSSVLGLVADNTQTSQTLNFQVIDLDPETEHCYALKAYDSVSLTISGFSNTICVTTLAAANSIPEFDFPVWLFLLLASGYLIKEKLRFVS